MGFIHLPSSLPPLRDTALPMGTYLIVAAAFTIAVLSLPAWAASFWQEVARSRATTPYASAQFLYAARPNLSTCVAGTLTQQAKDRALQGMNRIRALHGLAPVRYSYLYDRSVQEAALIQAANGYPGHHPPPRARCYTAPPPGRKPVRAAISPA